MSVFVCLSPKALHLEVVSGIETRNCLHAFNPFISRMGLCSHVYSDCGKNFVGVDAELRELFNRNSVKSRTIMEWHFNPLVAHQFVSLWEEAVKSFKFYMK